MILRKPYAFLIRHFRKINTILLVLVVFALTRQLSLYAFVNGFATTGIYNTQLDSIANYVNFVFIGASLLIVVISGILGYLLKYKEKPYISYFFVAIVGILSIVLSAYLNYYFTTSITGEFDLSAALVIRDLSFMMTFPYYPILILLLIRSIGLDLKNFGFGSDKEFAEIAEEDREEVEVEVSFDKDRYIRNFRKNYRQFKYFFLENRLVISTILVVVLLLGGYNVYNYVFVKNKVYNPGESFEVGWLSITTNNSYITNRDFTGNLVNNDRYYFILDTSISNKLAEKVKFDAESFYLYVDDKYYTPTDRFNSSFTDMGKLYQKGETIKAGDNEEILLVFEINKPREDSEFLLTYQNKDVSKKATRIKVSVRDISKFIEKDRSTLLENLTVPINSKDKWVFSFNKYEIVDSIMYRYEKCNAQTCPILEGELKAPVGKKLIHLRMDYEEGTKATFLTFLEKYGKIRYVVNGETKEEKIQLAIKKYQGNHVYLTVSEDIVNASKIELFFTVRSYQYFYNLKGE